MKHPIILATAFVAGVGVATGFARSYPGSAAAGPRLPWSIAPQPGASSAAQPPGDAGALHEREVQDALARNPALAKRLQPLLPSETDVAGAARGFEDLGQFVAAVHVAYNLDVPFGALRDKIVGPPRFTLVNAVRALKPTVDADAAVRKAEREARAELRLTGARPPSCPVT